MNRLYFKTSEEWKKWLKSNHDKESEVWLIFFKDERKESSIDYESAVEEALCFGWIDSIIKKIDDREYVRKFTPRNDNSKWSELNKKRVAGLIKKNRMTKIGLAKVETAKRNGMWSKSDRPDIQIEIPKEFKSALNKNLEAKNFFNQLAPTYQKQYILWIIVAKQEKTREKRIKESIVLLGKGQKLGLK